MVEVSLRLDEFGCFKGTLHNEEVTAAAKMAAENAAAAAAAAKKAEGKKKTPSLKKLPVSKPTTLVLTETKPFVLSEEQITRAAQCCDPADSDEAAWDRYLGEPLRCGLGEMEPPSNFPNDP